MPIYMPDLGQKPGENLEKPPLSAPGPYLFGSEDFSIKITPIITALLKI